MKTVLFHFLNISWRSLLVGALQEVDIFFWAKFGRKVPKNRDFFGQCQIWKVGLRPPGSELRFDFWYPPTQNVLRISYNGFSKKYPFLGSATLSPSGWGVSNLCTARREARGLAQRAIGALRAPQALWASPCTSRAGWIKNNLIGG